MQIEIFPSVLKNLEHMVALHKKAGAPNPFDNVPDLVAYILASVADGSQRPGAWAASWRLGTQHAQIHGAGDQIVRNTRNTAPITAPRPITKDSSSGPQ